MKIAVIKAASAFIPAVLPPCHIFILYYFWHEYGRRVNRQYCSCSCWDTIFKGTYESGIASYKHFYFNATANTVKIWISTVFFIIAFYESWKYVLSLLFTSKIRYTMFLLFLSSLFSHYYAWWVCFNYWNDDFYEQWNHQLFFTFTEIISTGVVLYLCDKRKEITYLTVSIIASIALVHILSSGIDQFFYNVIFGGGFVHQILRDLAFMVPDILHAVLPVLQLCKSHKNDLRNFKSNVKRIVIIAVIIFIIVGVTFSHYL